MGVGAGAGMHGAPRLGGSAELVVGAMVVATILSSVHPSWGCIWQVSQLVQTVEAGWCWVPVGPSAG